MASSHVPRAFPGLVVAVDATGATDRDRRPSAARDRRCCAPDLAVGEWVFVSAGTVIDRLGADEAAYIRASLRAAIAQRGPAVRDAPGRRNRDDQSTREPRTPPLIPITTALGRRSSRSAWRLISGVSVFVNGYAVKQLPDAAVYTTLKNGVAALILLIVAALAVVPRAEVRALDRRSWAGAAGDRRHRRQRPVHPVLQRPRHRQRAERGVHPQDAVRVGRLLAVPFLGERLGWFPIAALGVLLAGQFLAAPPTGVVWGSGETMILAATLLWAVEVVLARRLLSRVGVVAAARRSAARYRAGRPRWATSRSPVASAW